MTLSQLVDQMSIYECSNEYLNLVRYETECNLQRYYLSTAAININENFVGMIQPIDESTIQVIEESIKDKFSNIIDTIKKVLSRAWKALIRFFQQGTRKVDEINQEIDEFNSKLEELKNNPRWNNEIRDEFYKKMARSTSVRLADMPFGVWAEVSDINPGIGDFTRWVGSHAIPTNAIFGGIHPEQIKSYLLMAFSRSSNDEVHVRLYQDPYKKAQNPEDLIRIADTICKIINVPSGERFDPDDLRKPMDDFISAEYDNHAEFSVRFSPGKFDEYLETLKHVQNGIDAIGTAVQNMLTRNHIDDPGYEPLKYNDSARAHFAHTFSTFCGEFSERTAATIQLMNKLLIFRSHMVYDGLNIVNHLLKKYDERIKDSDSSEAPISNNSMQIPLLA